MVDEHIVDFVILALQSHCINLLVLSLKQILWVLLLFIGECY